MKKTVMQLNKLDLSKSNPVLWLGNGVNRTFQGDSWEEIVETELKNAMWMLNIMILKIYL